MANKLMDNKKITIVTPSFNQGEFIERTIKSIWDQEGDFYIEHIIADGGSTDETVGIIKKYEKLLDSGEYPIKCKGINLIWWSKKDDGQADALNEAFEISTGDILGWLNSDDFYELGAIAKVVDYFFSNREADLIYGDMNFTDIEGNLIRQCEYLIDYNFWRLQNSCYICQPSTFFRREVFKKVGPFNKKLHYAFDYDFWLKIGLNKQFKIKRVCMGVLSNLRTYKDRKTESGFIKQRQEVIKILFDKRLFLNYQLWHALFVVFLDRAERLLMKK